MNYLKKLTFSLVKFAFSFVVAAVVVPAADASAVREVRDVRAGEVRVVRAVRVGEVRVVRAGEVRVAVARDVLAA